MAVNSPSAESRMVSSSEPAGSRFENQLSYTLSPTTENKPSLALSHIAAAAAVVKSVSMIKCVIIHKRRCWAIVMIVLGNFPGPNFGNSRSSYCFAF